LRWALVIFSSFTIISGSAVRIGRMDKVASWYEEQMPESSPFDPQPYYDALTALYLELFGHDWHLGYWLNAANPAEAASRLNEVIAAQLPLRENMTVLDVGCGVGGPACFIAERLACRITGVSNSHTSLAEAGRFAEQRGLAERVTFRFGDMSKLPFEDASFDALFACESIHNVPDPRAVASELARVLKPGGTAVVGDLFLRQAPDGSGPDLDNLTGFSFHLVTADAMIAALQEHGLIVHASFDVGHHVGPVGILRYCDICRDRAQGLVEPSLQKTILERTSEATHALAEGFRDGHLGWGVWAATKRAVAGEHRPKG